MASINTDLFERAERIDFAAVPMIAGTAYSPTRAGWEVIRRHRLAPVDVEHLSAALDDAEARQRMHQATEAEDALDQAADAGPDHEGDRVRAQLRADAAAAAAKDRDVPHLLREVIARLDTIAERLERR